MRGFPQRVLVGILGTVLVALLACPSPPNPPGPNGPGGAGGSIPTPPPPVTCDAACLNAVAVCPSVKKATCGDICNRIGHAYAVSLLAARGCPDVSVADPGHAAPSGAPKPNGR